MHLKIKHEEGEIFGNLVVGEKAAKAPFLKLSLSLSLSLSRPPPLFYYRVFSVVFSN
jgi:hypothetical protein